MDVRSTSIDKEQARCWSWPCLLIIFLASAAVFSNTLAMDLVFDDIPLIKGPGPVKSLANIQDMFTTGVSSGTTFSGSPPYYRPLFIVSLAVDHFIWKEDPFGYHLTSVLLHAIVSILVCLLASSLLRSKLNGFIAGLVFAVHPVHSEAVAYVAARNEILCALFVICAFLAYIWYRRVNKLLILSLSLFLFFLSLLSKEMAVTFPFLLLLYETGVRRSPLKKGAVSVISFFAVLGLYLLVRSAVLTSAAWESPPLPVRINTAFGIVGTYLRLLFVPFPLKLFYDVTIQWEFLQTAVIVPLIVLMIFTGLVFYVRRLNGPVFMALGWILVSTLPASGLPTFIKPALMAERYLYTPSIGLALCAGALFGMIYDRSVSRRTFKVAIPVVRGFVISCVCGLIILFSAITFFNNYNWQNPPTFWNRMIADAPDHPLGYFGLGNYLGRSSQKAEMARMYQRSLRLTMERQYDLADHYIRRGSPGKAEQAIRYLKGIGVSEGSVYNALGVIYIRQGKPAEAIIQFRKAVALEKGNQDFRHNLDKALMMAGPGDM